MIIPIIERKQPILSDAALKADLLPMARELLRYTTSLEEIAKGTPFAAPARSAASAAQNVLNAAALGNDAQTQKAIEELQKILPPIFEIIRIAAAKSNPEQ